MYKIEVGTKINNAILNSVEYEIITSGKDIFCIHDFHCYKIIEIMQKKNLIFITCNKCDRTLSFHDLEHKEININKNEIIDYFNDIKILEREENSFINHEHDFYYYHENKNSLVIKCNLCSMKIELMKKFLFTMEEINILKNRALKDKKFLEILFKDNIIKNHRIYHCPNCSSILLDKMDECYNCNKTFFIKNKKIIFNHDLFLGLNSIVFFFTTIILLYIFNKIMINGILGIIIFFLMDFNLSFSCSFIIIIIINKADKNYEIIEINITIKKYDKEIQKIEKKRRKLEVKLKDLKNKINK